MQAKDAVRRDISQQVFISQPEMNSRQAILALHGVSRSFDLDTHTLTVLHHVDLKIYPGEFVAIIGRSGSGKSSLLNILGCLDRASAGQFLVAGQNTESLNSDELAMLRSRTFGFIFQRYNLLAHLSALDNVILPAMYAGLSKSVREERARTLLTGLRLGDRLDHTPNKLSGGEQQRVSVARALINQSQVILADEPTGALDRKTSDELMAELCSLNAAGSTVIVVTHDPEIAKYAGRVIEISDGKITADRAQTSRNLNLEISDHGTSQTSTLRKPMLTPAINVLSNRWALVGESVRSAFSSIRAHRLRTALTVLGITMGIAAIVTILAIGAGFQKYFEDTWSEKAAQLIEIYPGGDWSQKRVLSFKPLTEGDLQALQQLSFIEAATPTQRSSLSIRLGNIAETAQVVGVGEQHLRIRDLKLLSGVGLQAKHIQQRAQVALINEHVKSKFFERLSNQEVLGQVLLVGQMPSRVIGVIAAKQGNRNLEVLVPYTTSGARLVGRNTFESITARINTGIDGAAAEQGINRLLTLRHGKKDFHAYNLASEVKQTNNMLNGLTLMMSLFGAISLLVGGIGVMNIMLVSVSERTREIGIRLAVGARQSNIEQQFLIEAVFVCLIGAVFGLLVCLLVSFIFPYFVTEWNMLISPFVVLVAVLCSSATGVLSGFWPARSAARLDPVVALARD